MEFGDPTYPLFPVFAFLGFVLVLIPLPWHFQAWNSGTCLFMIWTGLGCLNLFINSIVWHGNAIDKAPVWCDISTRFTVGLSVAIPAASLCINRRLYKIASCTTAHMARAHKKRAVMIDLLIGLGSLCCKCHSNLSCKDTDTTSSLTSDANPLLSTLPPPTQSLSYGPASSASPQPAFMKRRAEFSKFLSSNTSLTVNRYFRLMSLATVELMFNVPLSTYGLFVNATSNPIYKWKSWSDTHFMWYTIDTFPSVIWRQSKLTTVTLEMSRWSVVFCALLFFGFFGFAQESRKHYKKAYWAVLKRFGVEPPVDSNKGFTLSTTRPSFVASKSTTSDPGTLPVFVPRKLELNTAKRTSLESTSTYHKSDYTGSTTPTTLKTDFTFPPSPVTPEAKHGDIELALKRPNSPAP
ncbi:pheromone A receptor-domain-containing protein [Cyathus striatus]|nr:pheromone A receptor-domain-containing protein [Cyathus striatus]